MENTNQKSDNGKAKFNIWPVVSVFLILAVVGLVIWLSLTRSNLNQLLEEKELQRVELRQELDSLLNEHEKVKVAYGDLSDSLVVKDSVIQANAVEIKKLLNTQWEYYKVKKKLSQLQEIAQGYVRQMDSLYRVNEALTEENIAMKQDIAELKDAKAAVEKDREELTKQVEIASVLKAYNIEAGGIRLRSGGSKEVPTDKAGRIDKVKVCFTIGENAIVPAGERMVYVRIARPDKEILTKTKGDNYTFPFQGDTLQYSIMKTVNYENIPLEICLDWYKQYSSQDMLEGLYHVDIFADDNVIGHSTFTLR